MYTIETFDDAIDYVISVLDDGQKFDKCLKLVNQILENPDQYTGPQAAMQSIKISGYRVWIGLQAQHWKIKSAQTKKLQDRLVKDALMVMYDSLIEVINTLKLISRHEHDLVK